MNLPQNFFGRKNMYFLAGYCKSTRNFHFRPKFGHLKKFKFGILGRFFKNFDFGSSRKAENSGVLSEFVFGRKKIYFFWPETKNRLEISISGRNLAIWKIYNFGILVFFFKNFDFGSSRKAEICCVLSENFFGQ